MTTISATIIADSVGAHSPRVSTILTRSPRWIHAEGRTHRRVRIGEELEFEYRTPSPMEDPNLSRNASSSRAVPVPKMIEDVLNDPAVPLWWGANMKGMQALAELDGKALEKAKNEWFKALGNAVQSARRLHEVGAHKQLVNRLIEPFSHINVLWTGTQWTNFLALRDHEDAEPHIRKLAQAIRKALDGSKPTLLQAGEWHLPYVQPSDVAAAQQHYRSAAREAKQRFIETDLIRLSVARCASLSYRTVDDRLMSRDDAYRLYDRLLDAQPIHASPAEHQAKVDEIDEGRPVEDARNPKAWARPELSGNLGPGWIQFRKTLAGEEILSMADVIPPHWRCDGCAGINDQYMVKHEVWLSAMPTREGKLCLVCIEGKLGRALRMDDFLDAPINRPVRKGYEMAWREGAAGGVSERPAEGGAAPYPHAAARGGDRGGEQP